MNSYWLNLPVPSIRNTGTFFEGLALKVQYDHEKQICSVTFKDGTVLMFIERETFTRNTGIQWKEPRDYAGVISISMDDEDEMRNLLHIAMLSGGEIIKEPTEQNGVLTAYFEDYNGYNYNLVLLNTKD